MCQLFASAFGRPFIKVRPKFLEGLELDVHCKHLKIAFEYDGEQHFKFPNWFHRSQEVFQKLQADVARKKAFVRTAWNQALSCSILGQVQGASRVCE